MTKEDITVTYYYVHTSGGVIVNHIDIKTGKQLLDETKEEGYEGDQVGITWKPGTLTDEVKNEILEKLKSC